jgi:hypothetical protein
VDQRNVAEDADLEVAQSDVFDGSGLGDVFEVLLAVAGDTRRLRDEIFGEEFTEALGIAGLVRVDVVEVELFEDRQIFGVLLGVVQFLLLLEVRLSAKLDCRSVPYMRCWRGRLFRLVGVGFVAPFADYVAISVGPRCPPPQSVPR